MVVLRGRLSVTHGDARHMIDVDIIKHDLTANRNNVTPEIGAFLARSYQPAAAPGTVKCRELSADRGTASQFGGVLSCATSSGVSARSNRRTSSTAPCR